MVACDSSSGVVPLLALCVVVVVATVGTAL